MLPRHLLPIAFVVSLLAAPGADAAPPRTPPVSKVTKRAKPPRRGKRSRRPVARGKAAARAAKPGPVDARPALTWLRGELRAAHKAGKPSDLATLLLTGVLEGALPQALHTHYALAGLGKSLRKGAMGQQVVAGMAADMASNLRSGARTYVALSQHKAFGQLAGTFQAFATLSGQGAAAADALAAWAKGAGSAGTFDGALERYRAAVDALTSQLRGPK